jgi:hypothetical protein
MLQNLQQLPPQLGLVQAKPFMNVLKKIYKPMEEWDLLGNLTAISTTEDAGN